MDLNPLITFLRDLLHVLSVFKLHSITWYDDWRIVKDLEVVMPSLAFAWMGSQKLQKNLSQDSSALG